MHSSPSVRSATACPKSERTADAATDPSEMSRTEDVRRALSAVFTCGPSGSASVRSAIRGCAASVPSRADAPAPFSTCAACHGCTGTSTRSPSRSHSGHNPDTRHSPAGAGSSPSSTTGRCSGPYASCSAAEKPGRERQFGWKGCPSTTRCSHSQSRSGTPSPEPAKPRCPARDSANEAVLCASSPANEPECGTARSAISRAGSSYSVPSRRTAVTPSSVAYGSGTGPSSRRPSASRSTTPDRVSSRPVTHGSGSCVSPRHSRVSTAALAPGSASCTPGAEPAVRRPTPRRSRPRRWRDAARAHSSDRRKGGTYRGTMPDILIVSAGQT